MLGTPPTPCQTIATAFATSDPSNPFLLLTRYERAMHNSLLRLLKHFHSLQKHHPTVPYAKDEPPRHPEPALRPDHPALLAERAQRAAEPAAQSTTTEQTHSLPTPRPVNSPSPNRTTP